MDESPNHPDHAEPPFKRIGPGGPGLFGPEPQTGLSEVAQKRRDQILEAAEAIIAGEGIHKLSFGRIEDRLGGMSRGQLTYYFPTRESILLAMFERMLRRMIADLLRSGAPRPLTGRAWDCFRNGLSRHLDPVEPPPAERDLFSLLYTFLSEMGHRPDYRARLADLHREFRAMVAADVAGSVPEPGPIAPPIAAALIQALFHGIGMQLAVDPEAFDREEMFAACIRLFAPLFHQNPTDPVPKG